MRVIAAHYRAVMRNYDQAVIDYLNGETGVSIAERFGVNQSVVYKALRRRGVVIRPKGLAGDSNPSWKGDAAHDVTKRVRARNAFPEIGNCERCKVKPATDRHHIDRNTGNNARTNLMFLCRKCHILEDGRLLQLRQHPRPIKPARPCVNCGRLSKIMRKERCEACAYFFWRRGKERNVYNFLAVKWTPEDEALVLDFTGSNKELAALLNRTKSAVITKRHMLIKKLPPPPGVVVMRDGVAEPF